MQQQIEESDGRVVVEMILTELMKSEPRLPLLGDPGDETDAPDPRDRKASVEDEPAPFPDRVWNSIDMLADFFEVRFTTRVIDQLWPDDGAERVIELCNLGLGFLYLNSARAGGGWYVEFTEYGERCMEASRERAKAMWRRPLERESLLLRPRAA